MQNDTNISVTDDIRYDSLRFLKKLKQLAKNKQKNCRKINLCHLDKREFFPNISTGNFYFTTVFHIPYTIETAYY